MTDLPQQPSRILVYSALGTGVLAGLLWIGLAVVFVLQRGERMQPDEIRLALFALALGMVTTALWTQVGRVRTRYQTFLDYVPFRARLAELEQRLSHLDHTMSDINGRTQRLARILQEDDVVPRPNNEDTGELISRARHAPRLRSVPPGALG